MAKQKYYVVWSGLTPGIYSDWASCKAQVDGVAGAKYKSFPSREQAERAFSGGPTASGKSTSSSAGKNSSAGKKKSSRSGLKTYAPAEVDAHAAHTKIFTDGGCEPNPGEAGTGIAIYRGAALSELWFGMYNPAGTNNTAELNGLLHGLLLAKDELPQGNSTVVFSDSKYAIQCVTQWAVGWEKRGWTRPSGEIKNLELIQEIYALYQSLPSEIEILHVNGHVGVEGNELADRMSMVAVERQVEDFQQWQDHIDIDTILAMRTG